jgi:ribonuclease-3
MVDDAADELGSLEEFEVLLGLRFRDRGLLRNALTHSSAKGPDTPCNERLEFLGDSVLGLVIAEQLFRTHPRFSEGDLTQVKSVVVSSRTLARVGNDLGLERFVVLGKGIPRRQGVPASLVAGMIEAVIGAVFLDRGIEDARNLVLRWLSVQIENVLADRHRPNYKSILQNFAQKALGVTPTYRVASERGPAHDKMFEVEAMVGRRAFPPGSGNTKKDAEQDAAESALAILAAEAESGLPVPLADAALPLPWAGCAAQPPEASGPPPAGAEVPGGDAP